MAGVNPPGGGTPEQPAIALDEITVTAKKKKRRKVRRRKGGKPHKTVWRGNSRGRTHIDPVGKPRGDGPWGVNGEEPDGDGTDEPTEPPPGSEGREGGPDGAPGGLDRGPGAATSPGTPDGSGSGSPGPAGGASSPNGSAGSGPAGGGGSSGTGGPGHQAWGFAKGVTKEVVGGAIEGVELIGKQLYDSNPIGIGVSLWEKATGGTAPEFLPNYGRGLQRIGDVGAGLYALARDPSLAWQDIAQQWERGEYGEAIGTATGRIGSLVGAPEAAGAKLAGQIATIAGAARKAGELGQAGKVAEASLEAARNTGKWADVSEGMRRGGTLDDFLKHATYDEVTTLEKSGAIRKAEADKARKAKADGDRTKGETNDAETHGDKKDAESKSEPVVVTRGEYVEDREEFFLDGTIPLELRRSYGHQRGTDGPLGRNWTSLFDVTVEVRADNKLLYRDEEGRRVVFARPFGFEPARNAKYRHLALTAPWLKQLRLSDGHLTRCFAQGKDRVYRLTAIEDPHGNRIALARDGQGLLLRAEHSDGYALAFANDPQGRRCSVTLAMGVAERRLVDYAYDAAGNLLRADCATAFSLSYGYDAQGRLETWCDAVGRTRSRLSYDAQDRVVAVATTGPYDGDTFAYDAQARRTLYRPGGGAAAERTDYDADENVLAETDGLGAETRHAYEDGYRTRSTDPLGHATAFAYDADGNVTEVVDAEGRRTRLRWSGPGQLDLVLQSGGGGAWRYERDRHGNLIEARDPLGAATRFDWTPAGRLSAIHHPDGTSERRDYDAQHRLVAVTDPKGGVTRLSRDDPFGRVTAVTDPLGAQTRTVYDDAKGVPLATPSAVIRPDGVTIRRRFDGEGQVAEVVDGEGRVTRYAYGPFDELVSVTDPGGGVLSLVYDVRGLLVTVTNAHGRTYRYDRDGAGRVVAETDFDGRTLRYTRDAAGRVVAQENGDGSRVAYAYDRSGLLVARRGYAAGIDPGSGAPEVEERFAYDARGLLVRAENGDGVVTLTRDALGRIVSESRDGRTVESRYDARGRRIERRIGEGLAAYAYDPLGALTELTLADLTPAGPDAATTIAFARDALGRETGRASGGFRLAQAFDPLGQIVGQRAGAGSHALERRWSWNRAFEPVSIADGLWGGTAYATDANGQVTEARHGEGLPPPRADLAAGLLGMPGEQVEVERFAYEPTRDIAASDTALPGEPLGRALTPWLSSPGGKVKAARGADGSRILLTHDAQGRVVERRVERRGFRPKVWRYGWNALDRLVWCETPEGARWAYGYDPFGRRVWKRRVGSAPGGTGVERGETRAGEAYLWDGDVVAQAAPVTADGRVAWDRAVSWHHEPGTFRPVARARAGVVHHVVTDHLGTPRELYDGQGRRAWSRSHRLWGGTRGVWRSEAANDEAVSLVGVRAARDEADGDEADLCPIGFPGQWADNENGLSYNRFRYYDAEAGQYVSPDPIGLDGGLQPQGYVHRPVAELDPLGLAGCEFDKYNYKNEEQYVPSSSAEGEKLKEHLRQAQKYGQGGIKELENGRIRYYGKISPARTPGEMIGRRVVREWNPTTGSTRTWHETIDAAGNVRQVRPEMGGAKVHFRFDANGNYIGRW